jgi:hypothetical protein
LVLSARPDALWFAPSADITDEVIAELRANPLSPLPAVRVSASALGEEEPAASEPGTETMPANEATTTK